MSVIKFTSNLSVVSVTPISFFDNTTDRPLGKFVPIDVTMWGRIPAGTVVSLDRLLCITNYEIFLGSTTYVTVHTEADKTTLVYYGGYQLGINFRAIHLQFEDETQFFPLSRLMTWNMVLRRLTGRLFGNNQLLRITLRNCVITKIKKVT